MIGQFVGDRDRRQRPRRPDEKAQSSKTTVRGQQWNQELGNETGILRARGWVLGVVLGTLAITPLWADDPLNFSFFADWPMFGQNPANTANVPLAGIPSGSVKNLKTKWTFTTGGDVSARAAVVNGVAYFPDWGGNIWAVNANSGTKIWSNQISAYGLAAGTVSRTSPAVVNGIVYIGTQYVAPATGKPQPPTGWLLAINAATGKLLWKMQPTTSNAFPVITASPVVAAGIVFVGMTSNEEFAAASAAEGGPPYACCSARGSVVAVDAIFGLKLWETFTVPTGNSGGAVWGSNPVVDLERGTVFVGTGNNYSVPPGYAACIAAHGTNITCQSPDDHADSILALDMFTGRIKWATKLETWNQTISQGVTNGSDFWNVDCAFVAAGTSNCPNELVSATPTAGPDYDFGSAPNEITYQTPGGPKTIIGAGQKSGIYYALDPDAGAELWHTQVGPGSSLGGMEWGSASDGTRIYVAISNLNGISYPAHSPTLGSAGSWAALDPGTGAILWQVADPNGSIDIGPVAVANGVVYAASMAGVPTAATMFALDASTGKTLWSFAAGSSVNAGATIAGGTVYWGSGYAHLPIPGFTGNTKFYAFSINGQ
jgi:polyvinyl alcohol dehydrogenase (cytochrome)